MAKPNKRKAPPIGSASASQNVPCSEPKTTNKYAPKRPSARALRAAQKHDEPNRTTFSVLLAQAHHLADRFGLSADRARLVAELCWAVAR